MTDQGIGLAAGSHDRALLAASLLPPGCTVAVFDGAPQGIEDALALRGCEITSPKTAEAAVGGPDDIAGLPLVVVTAENLAHPGVGREGAGSSLADLDRAAAAGGRVVLARQRFFEQPIATDGPTVDQADPSNWVRWAAVLAGPSGRSLPRPWPPRAPDASVLLLAEEPFNRWPSDLRSAAVDLGIALQARGSHLVISWTPKRLTGSLTAHVDLRRLGIVLHGGDGVFDLDGHPPGLVSPTATSLLCAYAPRVAVLLDTARGDHDLAMAAHRALHTRFLGLGLVGGTLEGTTSAATLAPDVLGLIEDTESPTPARVPTVAVRPRRPGVTSVVIPVHGEWKLTEACLDSLAANTDGELDIIVVDNASPDETPERLADRPDVRVVSLASNLGFAGGTNRGIDVADGEFVCLLNNDTEVVDGWLPPLKAALSVPGAGIAGPRSNRISGFQVIPGAPATSDPTAHDWARGQAETGEDRSWLTSRLVGFCMLMRGDLLEEVGALDESVGIGNFEDDELGERVMASGRTLRVADGSLVLHHGSATFAAAGISVLDTMRGAARRVDALPGGQSRLLVASVAGTGDPALVEETVRRARCIADQVVVRCEGTELLPYELHGLTVDPSSVVVVDRTQVVPTTAPWELHLPADAHLDPTDWGRTRADLEALPRQAHRLAGIPGAVLRPVSDGHLGLRPPRGDELPPTDVIRRAGSVPFRLR